MGCSWPATVCAGHEVTMYFNVDESRARRGKQERRELNKLAPCLMRRRTPLWAALFDGLRELFVTNPT